MRKDGTWSILSASMWRRIGWMCVCARAAKALVEPLQALTPALIVIEAIGGYETVVASALAAAQLPLAVVNPRQIGDFARATGKLAKTDRLDAGAIAHFAEAVRPPVRPVADAQAQALGELVARRRQSLPWSASRQSTATAARCGAGAPSPRIKSVG
jgi:hypothetical protein